MKDRLVLKERSFKRQVVLLLAAIAVVLLLNGIAAARLFPVWHGMNAIAGELDQIRSRLDSVERQPATDGITPAKAAALLAEVPTRPDLSGAADEAAHLAAAKGVYLTEVSNSADSGSADGAQGVAAGGGEQRTDAEQVPLTFKVSGELPKLIDFFDELQRTTRLMNVTDWELTLGGNDGDALLPPEGTPGSGPYYTLELTVTAYAMPQFAGILDKLPAYDPAAEFDKLRQKAPGLEPRE